MDRWLTRTLIQTLTTISNTNSNSLRTQRFGSFSQANTLTGRNFSQLVHAISVTTEWMVSLGNWKETGGQKNEALIQTLTTISNTNSNSLRTQRFGSFSQANTLTGRNFSQLVHAISVTTEWMVSLGNWKETGGQKNEVDALMDRWLTRTLIQILTTISNINSNSLELRDLKALVRLIHSPAEISASWFMLLV